MALGLGKQAAVFDFLESLYALPSELAGRQSLLEKLADLFNGGSAWFSRQHRLDGAASGWVCRMDSVMQEAYLAHYVALDPFARPSTADVHPVTVDEDWLAKDDLVRSEFYNDFMRRAEAHSILMIDLGTVVDHRCAIHINRVRNRFDTGDLALAEHLRPHLIRATDLSQRLRAPATSPVTARALIAAYGLTQAEARVALALMDGASLRAIAERYKVSLQTVRNQLRQVFDKTEVSRQADLIRLLLSGRSTQTDQAL